MRPAKEVGGDFYDFFRVGECGLVFLIADVSGKGISGALFMMRSKTQIKNNIWEGLVCRLDADEGAEGTQGPRHIREEVGEVPARLVAEGTPS